MHEFAMYIYLQSPQGYKYNIKSKCRHYIQQWATCMY